MKKKIYHKIKTDLIDLHSHQQVCCLCVYVYGNLHIINVLSLSFSRTSSLCMVRSSALSLSVGKVLVQKHFIALSNSIQQLLIQTLTMYGKLNNLLLIVHLH